MSETAPAPAAPTVVLVHGAFADASSWNGVIKRLQAHGVPVTVPANPLRGTDVTRSLAQRAGATITEVDSSHLIMVSQPQAVTDVILEAVAAVGSTCEH
jgi:hypothetical protein